MRTWRLLAAAAALAGTSALGSAVPMTPPTGEAITLARWHGHGYPSRGPDFVIRMDRTGLLYPGVTRSLDLTIVNPHGYPIRVRTITGRLTSNSTAGCRPVAANLEIGPYRGRLPLIVPARSRRDAGQLEIHMPNSVADACQRARFAIRVDSEAAEVGR